MMEHSIIGNPPPSNQAVHEDLEMFHHSTCTGEPKIRTKVSWKYSLWKYDVQNKKELTKDILIQSLISKNQRNGWQSPRGFQLLFPLFALSPSFPATHIFNGYSLILISHPVLTSLLRTVGNYFFRCQNFEEKG